MTNQFKQSDFPQNSRWAGKNRKKSLLGSFFARIAYIFSALLESIKKSKAKRWGWTIGLCLAAVVTLSVGAYMTWLLTPPALPNSLEDAVALAGSARYQRLDPNTRARYMERMQQMFANSSREDRQAMWQKMRDDEQARQAMRQLQEDMMQQRMQEFFTATPEERNAMLDKILDSPMGRGGGPPGGPPPGANNAPPGPGKGPGNRPPGNPAQRMKNRMEKGNPQRQAYMSEFRKAMMERRKERGLPSAPAPGRRPGN
ncbi:MAG: hypothetical protein IT443_00425 [Phycisphaeraceae bacterium]|nr:hypothetical protein [Phycisphaeraceae bacterium]